MTRIKLIVGVSGTRNGQDWPRRGSVMAVAADEAASLIAAGIAIAVEDALEEVASLPVAENAKRPARARRTP